MTQRTFVEIDKTWAPLLPDEHGKIGIRVVVLQKKAEPEPEEPAGAAAATLAEAGEEDLLLEVGKSPLDSYLERPKHGKFCMVYLVNGQRHEGVDNSFIIRDLGFKYLRSRMMIAVDLDGLATEAIAEIVQGSRQGLYDGHVKQAIKSRLIATLKNDPDLKRLQAEAEQELSEVASGDEAIRGKLDELIDSHHTAATRVRPGFDEPGKDNAPASPGFGKDKDQQVVEKAATLVGKPATGPVIVLDPPSPAIRLRPGVPRTFRVRADPVSRTVDIEAVDVRLAPVQNELNVWVDPNWKKGGEAPKLQLTFAEPPGFDPDDYPVEATLTVFAKIKGEKEPRAITRDITVAKPTTRPPPPPPVLNPVASFLRVVSHQPVKLESGGASTHVRLAWDGQDSLATGPSPTWTFTASCLSLSSFPPMTFSTPRGGRFELLVDAPHGLRHGTRMDFEVRAKGPGGVTLTATFSGEVIVPVAPDVEEPRLTDMVAPDAAGQRRPPYALKVIHEADWNMPDTCWGLEAWTESEAGSFVEPTESAPLTLIINADMKLLRDFCERMVKNKLAETTIKERQDRYTLHVAYHLYAMYRDQKLREQAAAADAGAVENSPDQRGEINRVAATLIGLME